MNLDDAMTSNDIDVYIPSASRTEPAYRSTHRTMSRDLSQTRT